MITTLLAGAFLVPAASATIDPSMTSDLRECFIVKMDAQPIDQVIMGILDDPGSFVDDSERTVVCPVSAIYPKAGYVIDMTYDDARDRTPFDCWVAPPWQITFNDPVDLASRLALTYYWEVTCSVNNAADGLIIIR